MNRIILVLTVVLVILCSTVIDGIILVDLENEETGNEYTYPVSVGEETYIITVRTN